MPPQRGVTGFRGLRLDEGHDDRDDQWDLERHSEQ